MYLWLQTVERSASPYWMMTLVRLSTGSDGYSPIHQVGYSVIPVCFLWFHYCTVHLAKYWIFFKSLIFVLSRVGQKNHFVNFSFCNMFIKISKFFFLSPIITRTGNWKIQCCNAKIFVLNLEEWVFFIHPLYCRFKLDKCIKITRITTPSTIFLFLNCDL